MVAAGAEVSLEQGLHEALEGRVKDVDSIIIDYLVNVLKDETFDFGYEGEEAYEAVGPLLVAAELAADDKEARQVSWVIASARKVRFLFCYVNCAPRAVVEWTRTLCLANCLLIPIVALSKCCTLSTV